MPRLQLTNGNDTIDLSYCTHQGRHLLEAVVEDIDGESIYFGVEVTPQDLEALRAFCEEALAKFDDCPYERTPEEEELLNFTPLSDEELAELKDKMTPKGWIGLDSLIVRE